MRIASSLARLLCTAVILLAGVYTVTVLDVAGFIVTGTLTAGEAMYVDAGTPALSGAMGFAAARAAVRQAILGGYFTPETQTAPEGAVSL